MKKALQDVAEEDKPAAQAAFDLYQKRLTDRSLSGDYHNMRWQTLQDAQDFGNIYLGLAEKAKLIAAEKQKIAESKDYLSDASRSEALKQFQKKLKGAEFDAENRLIKNLTVSPFKEAADINLAEKWLPVASTIRTKTSRGQDAFFKNMNINGKNVLVKQTESGEYEYVSPQEIAKELKAWGRGDKDITAMIERDMNRMDITDPEQRKQMFEVLYNQETDKVAESLGNMYEVYKDTRKKDITPYFGADGDGSGRGKKQPIPLFTQRLSNIFKNNAGKSPFEVDENGNIKTNISSINQTSGAPAYVAGTYKEDFEKIQKLRAQGESVVENSTEYKRLKNHLTHLGKLKEGASKKEVNTAIVNFWNNEINNAQSSIAVALPGDEEANKYITEINKSYFGTPTPDANTKGSSILNGQLAQTVFTDEKGKVMSAQEVFEETKNRNVRVNGWVNQIQSPFEYGSHYMVAVDPNSGEQKHYLIEPDLNTKNSGAYFANRILNSTIQTNLTSKWQDGNGVNYEATPVKGGKSYLIYINGDDRYPIKLEENDLEVLAQLPAGQANQLMQQLYLSKNPNQ